jgi:hypothetical protein
MHEDYSLLWLGVSLTALFIAIFKNFMFKLTFALGAIYPASAIFFIAIVFVTIMNLHFSVKITKLDKENKELAQELALMRTELTNMIHELGKEKNEKSIIS